VIARITGAALRGILVAILVATPSLLLPGHTSDATEMVALLAILAGLLTFAEYNTDFPSFIEFRDAPPLNRLRFFALFIMFMGLTLVAKHQYEPTTLTALIAGMGGLVGHVFDFPYSPVRLMVLVLPYDAPPSTVDNVRLAAGVCYGVAIATMLIFFINVRFRGWPTSRGPFNVWVNLPLFAPTAGGDVVYRLQRDARVNIVLGFLLPFIIPALVKIAANLIDPISFDDPQTVIWTLSAWAFLPASMVMRGLAMAKIAELIEEKRRRVHLSLIHI